MTQKKSFTFGGTVQGGCVSRKAVNGSPVMIDIHTRALNKYLYVLCMMLAQSMVNFFLKEPDSKHFRIHTSEGVCIESSTLTS